jgi:hypothetical protein
LTDSSEETARMCRDCGSFIVPGMTTCHERLCTVVRGQRTKLEALDKKVAGLVARLDGRALL